MSDNSLHTTILKDISTKEVYTIDLVSDNPKPINIGKQWLISFEAPERIRFFNIERKSQKLVKIRLTKLSYPHEVLDVDVEHLFSVTHESEYSYLTCSKGKEKGIDITLIKPETYFQLFLHPEAIVDCKEVQSYPPKSYNLSFRISLLNENNNEITYVDNSIQIQFTEVHSEPKLEFVIDDKYKKVNYHSDLAIRKIGILRVTNPAPKQYFPPLDGTVTFQVFCDGNEVDKQAFYFDVYHHTNGASIEFLNQKVFSFKGLNRFGDNARNTIEIPIWVDFGVIGNPYNVERKVFNLKADVSFNHSNNTSIKGQSVPEEESIVVIPDKQKPQLLVLVKDRVGEEMIELRNGSELIELSTVEFVPGNGMGYYNELLIDNVADGGYANSGIWIENFNYSITVYPDNNNHNSYASGLTQQDVFLFKEKGLKDLKNNNFIASVKNTQRHLFFGFDENNIKEINIISDGKRSYDCRIRYTINFDYYIDEYGAGKDNSQKNVFSSKIEYKIHQKPYPKWLGIDFGTSAIVCQYGDDIFNLHEIKNKKINGEDDSYERDTPFLSSNVLLQQSIKQDAPKSQLMIDYNDINDNNEVRNLAVRLSASSSAENKAARYMLPCLKLLMGYSELPNIANYNDFFYYRKQNDGTIVQENLVTVDANGDSSYGYLGEVNHVFEEVYRQLFNFYVRSCIKPSEYIKINRLILSVPNTYTPIHLKNLHDIIINCFSDMNIRDVRFISESDAVACYYQSNWAALNRKYRRDTTDIENHERVLIYDMGAGTLDVTLFEKTKNENKIDIEVIGKVGISKAGNYLDSLIAQLLVKKYPKLKDLVGKISNGDDLTSALLLKNLIKEQIKPALSLVDSRFVTITEDSELFPLFVDKKTALKKTEEKLDLNELIINQKEYSNYLNDCTIQFFDNFFKFLGYQNSIEIDTIITSGRSAKLMAIQEHLQLALNKWCSNGNRILIDLSIKDDDAQYDLAKTSVVEGALSYATKYSEVFSDVKLKSPNIMANYGVIYEDANGKTLYQELLNPRKEKPTNEYENEGMVVRTYETTPITLNLASSNHLTLIQSYSSDTEKDWINDNREYITEMSTYDVSNKGQTQLSIEVDRDNILTLRIGGANSSPMAPVKIDLNSKSNQMSLWPMTIK